MTLEQLTKLYILQKNHHEQPDDEEAKLQFENEYHLLMKDCELDNESLMAPPLYKNQPEIPFVVFKLKSATVGNKKNPLIIHTHGGPNVHVDAQLLHAEIAYFLSHGYVVACPNYRGSTDCPSISEWVERSNNKHRIYGPEDVYTVAKLMQEMPYVDQKAAFLRGGSFGSYINAHLLADIGAGKFVNLFAGVHLSGGVKYPVPASMPTHIPLLITHGALDGIAPFDDAQIFMEKMVLKRLSDSSAESNKNRNLTTHVAQYGNHHLIDPSLELSEINSISYNELTISLDISMSFITNLVQNKPAPGLDYQQQLSQLTQTDSKETLDKQIIAYKDIVLDNRLPQQTIPARVVLSSTSKSSKLFSSSPTQALLKIYLGDQYTGSIDKDMKRYLQGHFAPVEWSDLTRPVLKTAGTQILNDVTFNEQINHIINRERGVLSDNPDYTVMYHVADNKTLQLYSFINLWQAIIQGLPTPKPELIQEMRLYDFMKNSMEDSSIFLRKMRKSKSDEGIFNNTSGFSERALSCNPTIISNAHSTASCSLWWYFKAESSDRAPIEPVIKDLLEMLGIYTQERLNRYTQLFENHRQLLGDNKQALLQQFFMPYTLANKAAYMCQIWGEEFNPNTRSLDKPEIMSGLTRDPIAFENELRSHKAAFVNHGDCPGFGDTAGGFKYASVMQMRYLPRSDKSVITYSYFRSLDAHKNFFNELSLLVREDYADYLSYGTPIPDSVMDGSSRTLGVYANQDTQHAFFETSIKPNYHVLYKQQSELYKGLVQNPRKQFYGDIIAADKTAKEKIQTKLKQAFGQESKAPVYLYSLCLYLKGYTYFDLLKEAVDSYKFKIENHPKITPARQDKLKQDCEFFMNTMERFSIPGAIEEQELNPGSYHRLKELADTICDSHNLDSDSHRFFDPESGKHYSSYLWSHEHTVAKNSVMQIAYLAKEKAYGNDIARSSMELY